MWHHLKIVIVAVVAASATATSTHAQSVGVENNETLTLAVGLVIVAVLIALFFVPTIVAFRRGHPNRGVIAVFNLVFGGTGLGWLGSLVWACGAVHKSPSGNNGGESGLNLFVNDPVLVEQVAGPSLASEHNDAANALKRLKSLRDHGAIDEEEYAVLRAPLIEKLSG